MIPAPGPLPFRTRQEVRLQLISILTELYAAGPGGTGRADAGLPPDGKPWTGAELAEAFAYAVTLFLDLAFEVDAANAEGRPADVSGRLQQVALNLARDPVTGPYPGTYLDNPGPELPP